MIFVIRLGRVIRKDLSVLSAVEKTYLCGLRGLGGFFLVARPRRTMMAYSAFVAGCTDRRLPFCVTIIFSRPRVDFRVSSDTTDAKRSTNAMSTMCQIGLACLGSG